MASKVDMSLDDIIKTDKIGRTRGRGRGRGGFVRGRGRARIRGGRGRGSAAVDTSIRQVTTGRIRKPRRGNFASTPQSARWLHDRFEGGIGYQNVRQARVGPGARSLVKLVLSNLDYGVNDQDLKELFGEFGGFVKAYVHYDISGRSNGTAFILFNSVNAAEQARKQYHGVQLDGRPMDIQLMGSNTTNNRPIAPARFENIRGGRGSFRGGARGARIGRGGGRGRGRGRGRGGSTRVLTKEELDNQLDNYNSQTD